jgi:hypothetical protein
VRQVRPLSMDIYVDLDGERLKLYEDRQEFVDGRIRRRPNMTTSLGEKLEPGEDLDRRRPGRGAWRHRVHALRAD